MASPQLQASLRPCDAVTGLQGRATSIRKTNHQIILFSVFNSSTTTPRHHGFQLGKSMCQPDYCISTRKRNSFGARLMLALIWRGMIAVFVSTMQAPALAKTEVEGPSDAVRLSAEDASVNEVLAALSARFNLTYTPAPELNRAVAGVYSGTLQQILARILDGYDYVASGSVNGIELKLLGRAGSSPRP